MKTVNEFQEMKQKGKKISIVTAYDYTSAYIASQSNVDAVMVGDSLVMVMHGHSSTIPGTLNMMGLHTQAVARGAQDKFIIADMPFLSFRKGQAEAMEAVHCLISAGAHAVKLEGVWGHENVISHIVQSGIPVMGHIGFTPQSVHQFGSSIVQGKSEGAVDRLVKEAKRLEELGCFSIVLECVSVDVAREITSSLTIPTIGIGAGASTDGQVLVWQDLLGLNPLFKAKFVRRYANGFEVILNALNQFDQDVKMQEFPNERESYA